MKLKKRKDDTGLYMRQWNMELRETISRNMIAYEQKVRECRELKNANKDLKMLCSRLEREHETVYQEWKAVIDEYRELKQELQEANESITWWTNRFNAVERDKKQLQNNRDKAIEYIEKDLQISILPNNQIINGTEVVKRINKIIDLLKGDSDE